MGASEDRTCPCQRGASRKTRKLPRFRMRRSAGASRRTRRSTSCADGTAESSCVARREARAGSRARRIVAASGSGDALQRLAFGSKRFFLFATWRNGNYRITRHPLQSGAFWSACRLRPKAEASSELVVVFCRLFIRRTRGRQSSVRRADASARVARAMNTMDDYIPSDAEVVEGASRKRPAAILAAHFISIVLWVAFAMYDIHRNAAGNRAVPARVGAASGKLGVTRYATLRPRTAMTRARARVSLRPNSARARSRPPRPSRARAPTQRVLPRISFSPRRLD